MAQAPTLPSPASVGRKVFASWGGNVPTLPSSASGGNLNFGLSSEPNALTWMTSSGVPWTYRYTYLSAGVNTGNGWETWNTPAGQYATYYMKASAGAADIPVVSYYELLQYKPATEVEQIEWELSI